MLDTPDSAPEIINILFRFAIENAVSDILLEPQSEWAVVRMRLDGVLHFAAKIPMEIYNAVISRLKVMSDLDITVHRVAQEGKISYEHNDRVINIRVAVTQVVTGEFAALRLHDSSSTLYRLEDLGLQNDNLLEYRTLLRNKSGLIITCGPTGSGKTSTLYSSLQVLNTGQTNIISVEDPVEYILPGLNQMQVDKEHGNSFADGLRVILRLDPDIIFVGEIRDGETAHIAIESALTGHLVLSTMHANSAISAIFRLRDLEIDKFFINAALIGVIAQRLVRKTCTMCAEEVPLSKEETTFYQRITGESIPTQLKGRGCENCAMTGFKGRIGVYEIMIINDTIRALISNNATEQQLEGALNAQGYVTLLRDGMGKVKQRLTTVEEVLYNAYTSV